MQEGQAAIWTNPPAAPVAAGSPASQADAIYLLQADRDALTRYNSIWSQWLDTIGVPGYAGDKITAATHLIGPQHRGLITGANAYALADERFRELNAAAGGTLRADDFAAILNAYRSAAGLDQTPTIGITPAPGITDWLALYGQAVVATAEQRAQEAQAAADYAASAAGSAIRGVGEGVRDYYGTMKNYGYIVVIGLAVGLALLGGGFGAVQGAKR